MASPASARRNQRVPTTMAKTPKASVSSPMNATFSLGGWK